MQLLSLIMLLPSFFSEQDLNGRFLTVYKAAPRGQRPVRAHVVEPSFRIYVGNLPWQVDDARLEEVFSEHGKVTSARVVLERERGRSRGFGFVTMSSEMEVNDAISALDGKVRPYIYPWFIWLISLVLIFSPNQLFMDVSIMFDPPMYVSPVV